MSTCSAFGCCNSKLKKIPGITFHRFPADLELREEWISAVRRKGWRPTKSSVLCSEHFVEQMMDRTSLVCVRLRENAVPSIFKAFPSYSQKVSFTRKAPKARRNELLDQPFGDVLCKNIVPDVNQPSQSSLEKIYCKSFSKRSKQIQRKNAKKDVLTQSQQTNKDSESEPSDYEPELFDHKPTFDYEHDISDNESKASIIRTFLNDNSKKIASQNLSWKQEKSALHNLIYSLHDQLFMKNQEVQSLQEKINDMQLKHTSDKRKWLDEKLLLMTKKRKLETQIHESKSIEEEKERDILIDKVKKIFTPGQIKCLTSPTHVQWSDEDITIALTLRAISQDCYQFLRGNMGIPLPGISTLERWVKK